MREHFSKRYFRRILITYAITLILIIALFAQILYIRNKMAEAERNMQMLEGQVRLLTQLCDGKFSECNDACLQLSDDTWVKKIRSESDIIQKQMGIQERRSLCEIIDNYEGTIGLIRNAALFMPRKGQVIDDASLWETEERYLSSIGITQHGFAETFYAQIDEHKNDLVFLPVASAHREGDLWIGRQIDLLIEPELIFAFEINGQQFAKMIQENHEFELVRFSIVYAGDAVVYQMHNNVQQEVRMETTTFQIASKNFNLRYEIEAYLPTDDRRGPSLALCYTFLVPPILGAVLAYVLAMWTYMPLMKLMNKMRIGRKEREEFLAIESSFMEINEEKREAQQLKDRYYDVARNNMMVSLLHGSFVQRINDVTMRLLDIPFSEDANMLYMVVLLACETTERDFLHGRVLLQNNINQEGIPAILCETPDKELLFILYEKEKEDTEKSRRNFSRYFNRVRSHCSDIFAGQSCTCGMLHHGILGISKSYQEAKEQRMGVNAGCMEGYYYPLDWEVQLITQLRNCNAAAVERMLRELKRENMNRRLSTKQMDTVLFMIFDLIQRVANELNYKPAFSRDQWEQKRSACKEEALWDALTDIAVTFCRSAHESRVGSAGDIGRKMREYVECSFRDVNLSQKSVADQFGISPPQMSKLFKKETDRNFIDYLNALRTSTAKRILDEGALDIRAVARECGYENEVTFRRTFFRAYAITPHQYVNQMHEEKG